MSDMTQDWLQGQGIGLYDYNSYVTPSATSNWGTVGLAQPWSPSYTPEPISAPSLGSADYVGAGLTGVSAVTNELSAAAGVTGSSFSSIPALVNDFPSAVGSVISVGQAYYDYSQGNYSGAFSDLGGAVGAMAGGDIGGELGGMIGGALVGAAEGAVDGSIVPGIGTVVGAVGGALLGTWAGYEGSTWAWNDMFN